jgi:hypothetical protein
MMVACKVWITGYFPLWHAHIGPNYPRKPISMIHFHFSGNFSVAQLDTYLFSVATSVDHTDAQYIDD